MFDQHDFQTVPRVSSALELTIRGWGTGERGWAGGGGGEVSWFRGVTSGRAPTAGFTATRDHLVFTDERRVPVGRIKGDNRRTGVVALSTESIRLCIMRDDSANLILARSADEKLSR